MPVPRLRTIDLFAGAGGLTLGFHLAEGVCYEPVFAVEHDAAAARTFAANLGAPVHAGGIEELDPASYPAAEVIVGGPPCQGFSPLGRDRDDASRAGLNRLWEHFIEAVRAVRPRAFVIENVPEFHRSAQFATLLALFSHDPVLSRYGMAYGTLDASEYGVPQRRRRGILVAAADREVPWPPPPTHGPAAPGSPPWATVRDAIADLPEVPTAEEPHMTERGLQELHLRRNPRPVSLERYRCIPEGGNRFDLMAARPDITPRCWLEKPTGTTDVMGRMWWDRPAPTIRTEFFKPEKGRYLHPSADRPITHREAARLQSFPDTFVFEGNKAAIARQIGNAVPPLLGRAIAEHVARILQSRPEPNPPDAPTGEP